MSFATTTNAANAARRSAVIELVKTHSKLEEELTGAIWLSTRADGVWLLEVLPAMPPDDRVTEPMEFIPSKGFRYTLRLLTGREDDFLRALSRDVDFAAAVAAGTPVPRANSVTKRLQARAQKTVAAKKPRR